MAMVKKLPKFKSSTSDKIVIVAVVIIAIAAIVASSFSVSNYKSPGDIAKPAIAVIPIYGTLTVYGDGSTSYGVTELIELIEQVDSDSGIKAIIFEINSPGGTVVASEELAAAIKNTEKPTVAWLREVAASGGYWTASACDKIVADPATITGSIGVIGSYLQFSDLMNRYGITYERLVSGEYKDTGSPYKELTPAEREFMMKKIDAINKYFVNAVAENRNLDKDYVESLATGAIYLGTEAKELGLVDELGSELTAQQTAEKLAGISNSRLVTYEKELTFWDLMGVQAENSAYWVGRGIGDAWNLLAQEETKALKAEI